jgi:hypothetical protein
MIASRDSITGLGIILMAIRRSSLERQSRGRNVMRRIRSWLLGSVAISVTVIALPAHAESAMLAYGKSGSSQPRYRLWSGSAWGAESSATSVGSNPQWLVLRGSPVSNQFALATLDNDYDVEVQIWNGSTWGTILQATPDAADKTYRVFDMAYEQVSGHLLLAYRETGTSNMRYRTYNGTSWSAEQSLTITSGNIVWLSLAPNPNNDNILLTIMSDDSSNHARAAIWNGSSFGNLSSSAGWIPLHGAYESNSGQALIYYGNLTDTPGYRTFTGSWSSPTNAPNVGATPTWCWTYAEPGADRIFAVTIDDNRDINMTRWSGTGWSSATQFEGNTAASNRRGFDLAFEPEGNHALFAYDDNSNSLKYRTWDGFGWSVEITGPTGGAAPLWTVQTVAGVDAGQIFVTYCTDLPELRTVVWDGSSFGSVVVLGGPSSPKENEVFMTAVAQGTPIPKLISWQEVQP